MTISSTSSLESFITSPYQNPRIHKTCPSTKKSLAKPVLVWLEAIGLKYDPWQQTIFYDLFAVDEKGNWANSEYGALASRQQGKSRIIAGYILAHLFLFPSEKPETQKIILVSAHLVETAGNIYKIAKSTILSNDKLSAKLEKHLDTLGGQELLALPRAGQPEGMGNSVRFRARQGQQGRGFSAQILVFDEAQIMSFESLNALDYTQSTFSNTQMVFMGTVPQPQDVSEVFTDLRDRGRTPAGEHKHVGWAEWSPEGAEDHEKAQQIDMGSLDVWAQAVPSLGHRISVERIQKEWDKYKKNPEGFAKERLSIWPSRPDEGDFRYNDLDLELWDKFAQPEGTKPSKEMTWAIVPIVGLGGGYASVCAATVLPDERIAVIHLDSREYRTWVGQYLKEQLARFPKSKIFVDAKNASVIERDFFELGIEPVKYQATQIADAFDEFHMRYEREQITHYSQDELKQSFQYVQPRKVGNMGFTWEGTNTDISPTQAQAATLAVYAAGDKKNFHIKKPAIVRGW